MNKAEDKIRILEDGNKNAMRAMAEKNYAEAAAVYAELVKIDPGNPALLSNYSVAQRRTRDFEGALSSVQKARAIDPSSADFAANMARVLIDLNRQVEALDHIRFALQNAPHETVYRVYYATALRDLYRFDEALEQLDEALKVKPDDAEARWQKAVIYLLRGQFSEGWKYFEARRNRRKPYKNKYAMPHWAGEDLTGKTILIYEEQGFGDTILAARFIPLVKKRGARVILGCRPAMHKLFGKLEGVDNLSGGGPLGEKFDYHASLFDLFSILGMDFSSIPAPARMNVPDAPPAAAAKLLEQGKYKLKVGIVWSGNPDFEDNHKRAVHVSRFLELAKVPGVQFFSLQKGAPEKQLGEVKGADKIIPLGPLLEDFSETAAVIKELDLVIMTDSAVAHLAGSMGCPVWNLLDTTPFWLYMIEREDSPWYPSMRLFRQPTPGDWAPVFEEVAAELEKAVKLKKAGQWRWPVASEGSAVERAHALYYKHKFAEAAPLYEAALAHNRDDYIIWGNLGISLHELKHHEAAVSCLKRALELRPGTPALLRHYGRALASLNKKDESLRAFEDALKADPGNFDTISLYASALRDLGLLEEALEKFDEAYKIKPSYIDALWFRCDILLNLGRFREGWENYEIRWKLGSGYPFTRLANEEKKLESQRWTGQGLNVKTIMIYMEQGFGDTIFASRYIPMVKARGARVIVRCHPDLHRLFSTIPGADRLAGMEKLGEGVDYHVPIMSLPAIFGTDMNTIPPPPLLYVPAEVHADVAALFERAKDRLKVGIIWSGSPGYGANHKRSASFKQFLPLANIPGVQLYSLQKGEAATDIIKAGAEAVVPELGPYLKDFADTAAILRKLDLVIMTDTSVAHLAGSMGCPVWNLLAYRAYWIYFTGREDSPWYPSMRLFRQPEPGDWEGVFSRVTAALEKAVKEKRGF